MDACGHGYVHDHDLHGREYVRDHDRGNVRGCVRDHGHDRGPHVHGHDDAHDLHIPDAHQNHMP